MGCRTRSRFNRTFMELKFLTTKTFNTNLNRFNRTFMELKYGETLLSSG